MSLRGAKKLQTIALVLYAAALGATLLYIPTQSFWKRSAAVSPEAIACVTVPVSSLIGAALRLVLAAVWLACLRGVKDKPLKGSVIALSILLGAYAIAVEPIAGLVETLYLGTLGSAYVESAGAGATLLRLTAGVPSSAAFVLMLLSMGGGYGKTAQGGGSPDGGVEGEGRAPLRGAKTLQTVAVILSAAALALILLYIPTQSFWKRIYGVSPEVLSCTTVPVSYLFGGLFRLAAAGVWLSLLRRAEDRPLSSSVISLAIVLGVYSLAISPLVSLIENRIAANGGTMRFVSLTVTDSLLGYATLLPYSASYILMLLSMGRGYGKAAARAEAAEGGAPGETRS